MRRLAFRGAMVVTASVAAVGVSAAVAGSDPALIVAFAGSGVRGSAGDGGPATLAQLDVPAGLATPRGRPARFRASQNLWFGGGAIAPRTLKPGSRWRITGSSVACRVRARAVRCHNGAGHGFTITRHAYRAF